MESVVRSIRDDQNIVTVWLDVPGKPVNICSPQLLADLSQALDSIEHDKPAGVIFSSPKPKSFNAGADLFEIRKMMREQVLQYLADGQALFNRIAALSMPTVAAINGDCLGGGFEFAHVSRRGRHWLDQYRPAGSETWLDPGLGRNHAPPADDRPDQGAADSSRRKDNVAEKGATRGTGR